MYQTGPYDNGAISTLNGIYAEQRAMLIQAQNPPEPDLVRLDQWWESRKTDEYLAECARNNINAMTYAQAELFVQSFIKRALETIRSGAIGNPYYNQGYTNPYQYMNQGYPMTSMPTQFGAPSPFAMSSQQNLYRSPYGMPQQAPVVPSSASVGGNLPGFEAPKTTVNENQSKMLDKGDEQTNKVVIRTVEYRDPKLDTNETVYGLSEHDTSLGTIKVNVYRDQYEVPFEYVVIRLKDPCRNKQEALMRAQLIYKKTGPVHMDIQYDLTKTINVSYEKTKRTINAIKKALPKTEEAANKLKYIQSIKQILDSESRGVANEIEDFLIDRFSYVASHGCTRSDTSDVMIVDSLNALIDLSNPNSPERNTIAWHKQPGFMEALIKCSNATIKKDLTECILLDPSNKDNLIKILRHFTGLTETYEGKLVDVTAELMGRVDEFAAASQKDRSTLFGPAGELVSGSTTILLKNQHLVYTTLVPPVIITHRDKTEYISDVSINIGGFDSKGEPNMVDNDFEYMMTKISMNMSSIKSSSVPSDVNYWTDLIIDHGSILGSYVCVPSSDKWISIVRTNF